MITKKYKVGIYTLGKTFLVNGKIIRSPFETIASEKEVASFKIKIKTEGIDNYLIEEIVPVIKPMVKIPEVAPIVIEKTKKGRKPKVEESEIKIEELENKSKSLLEKYATGEI